MSRFEALADQVVLSAQGFVARALETVSRRLESLEKRLIEVQAAKGEKGEPGAKGDKGDPGEPGEPGKNGEPIHPDTVALMVRELVEKAVAALPKAIDGRAGDPGRDAADIHPLPEIDESRSYPAGTWAKHNGGLWLARSITQGMTGWDCVVEGVLPLAIETADNRHFTIKLAASSGKTVEMPFAVPSMLHRGIWKEGEYERGDVVTWDGSSWHCEAEKTAGKPGSVPDWRLVVKRGQNGRDGKNGERGLPGAPGRSSGS
jgi:hypothetical protein